MRIKKVFAWSYVISIGGFLFGFDTAVISGAEQKIQLLWDLNAIEHGLTVSIALVGTVVGAMLGGVPSDRFGRRKTIFGIAVLFLVSAVGTALAFNWIIFLFFRLVGGLAVGCSSVTAPMYISELSPASHRGRLVAMFQINVVLGILLAYLSNYLLKDIGENAWRWMLGVQAFPAAIYAGLILFTPESPRWLIVKKNLPEAAREILHEISPNTAERDFRSIQSAFTSNGLAGPGSLFKARYAFPILLAMLFAFFNQAVGINAVIYYAPRIFEMAGARSDSALLSAVGLGTVNFIFTVLAMSIIDHVGRKKLMLIGSAGMIVTLALVSRAFYEQDLVGLTVPIYLLVFIAFFSFSQGAVIWVFISEIFPTTVRSSGQALGSFTHWLMAALIAFMFPYMSEKVGGGTSFMVFAGMAVLQLVFVLALMPETKGKTLEELSSVLSTPDSLETNIPVSKH